MNEYKVECSECGQAFWFPVLTTGVVYGVTHTGETHYVAPVEAAPLE